MNLKSKIFYGVVGFILGNFFLLAISFGINSFNIFDAKSPEQITISNALELIKTNQIIEADFEQSQATFTDKNQNQHLVIIGSDPTREILLNEINKYNAENGANHISVSEAPSESKQKNFFISFSILLFVIGISSPIIIIVLLIIIIKKMNNKSLT